MEKFDLRKYESGDYDVVTRDGRGVRILCTDANLWCEEFKIVALVDLKNRNIDDIRTYTIDGIYDTMCESEIDLFLKKKKWTPKEGEEYWYVGVHGEVFRLESINSEFDNEMINFGNYFKTKKEAEEMAIKIRQVLNS